MSPDTRPSGDLDRSGVVGTEPAALGTRPTRPGRRRPLLRPHAGGTGHRDTTAPNRRQKGPDAPRRSQPLGSAAPGAGPMITVALIGPDGAGKSSIAQRLEHEPMPAPVKRIYMGVNLEASSLMLPTTRLALAVKTARGRRADMVAPGNVAASAGSPTRRAVTGGARVIRLLMWLAEEWFRMAVAEFHRRRGAIVVFDRHFFADYYRAGTAGGGGPAPPRRLPPPPPPPPLSPPGALILPGA